MRTLDIVHINKAMRTPGPAPAQAGSGLLDIARKLDPNIGERFMIFVRGREQKQRGGSGSDSNATDLLSYVEFQASRAPPGMDCKGVCWACAGYLCP